MPTYKNNSGGELTVAGFRTLQDGETLSPRTGYIPDPPTDLDLIDHKPRVRPFTILYDSTVPSGVVQVHRYEAIMLYNGTDSAATVELNEDTTNVLYLPIGAILILDIQKADGLTEVHCVKYSAGGSGNATLWGLERND
jgi:hypothetical protein